MRTKTLNFQTGTIDKPLGYVGENNETQLIITPPDELVVDGDITTYVVAFGANGNVYHSAPIAKSDTITCNLWSDATSAEIVTIQLEALDDSGDILAKSQMIVGKFLPSVTGKDAESDPEISPLIGQIVANTAARHTHSNKETLDAISDISGATNGDVLMAQNGHIVWQTVDLKITEIANTPSLSTYTAHELIVLEKGGATFTYLGEPVMATGRNVSETEFYFTVTAMDGSHPFIKTMEVQNNRIITTYGFPTSLYLLRSINNKTMDLSADLTLNADDIKATALYAPANDVDIATKKYVDDSISVTDVQDGEGNSLVNNGIAVIPDGGAITEKILELALDWDAAAADSLVSLLSTEIFLLGDQTANNGLLYNARITGIELKDANDNWISPHSFIAQNTQAFIMTLPYVYNDGSDDYTVICSFNRALQDIMDCLAVRIHYIEIGGTEVVNND